MVYNFYFLNYTGCYLKHRMIGIVVYLDQILKKNNKSLVNHSLKRLGIMIAYF
jgi:hypothetical protein